MDKIGRLALPACALCCLIFAVTKCEAQSIDFKREAAGRLLSITNTTVELIGPWIYIARYIIYLMAKEPVRPDFFYDFLEQRTQPTFKNLINQVRIHQPYIYQLFQVILVLTNITAVVSISILGLRSVGTCGASTCQDVTINYRLLFHTYTASALIICGFVIVGGVFVITCDYRINTGVDLLGIFVHGYRDSLLKFLLTDVVNTSEASFKRMVDGLEGHRTMLVSSVFNETVQNQQSWKMKLDVIRALEDSTLFQRRALTLDITDLINKVRGQLYIFTHEVENIKVGVENMTSILLTPGKNLLYIPSIQKVVTWSIMSFVVFLSVSMGGMMTGFILGYANHDDHASPLERNTLSNIGGYFLVLTSYCMLFGVTGMLFFSGVFMLLGSIGDLYLCRATRGYERSNVAQLKDLAVSLVMNATVNRYHVLKLLRYSTIEKHCVEHQGIAGLAGIHPSAIQTAFDNIVLTQYDLANHFSINIDKLIDALKNRSTELKKFDNYTNDLKMLTIKEELDFAKKVASDTVSFKKVVYKAFQDYSLVKCDAIKNDLLSYIDMAFQDYSLVKCDAIKNDLLSYIDMFDKIGSCRNILNVFEESFRILCNGMLDYVNGFWLAMLILVGVFDYAIYISIVASKYLFTMTTYTYEGEPVPSGLGTVTADQKLRQEAAEKRMSREPDAVMKDDSQATSAQPSSADKSTSVQAGSQPSQTATVVSQLSQIKPVAVKPPAWHTDELAPEFR
ncbi:hypothetical protein HPB50_001611 [Hyalomma asiaticum]|uniref:Uncharacterized protein n=1 Tax=Hyalomma asiaticum TaxID=266040 RepID=A0ACB7RZS5_HYAAI|nr:hypothetical protein HPB50_001611 [Hyalomma asiaticum]